MELSEAAAAGERLRRNRLAGPRLSDAGQVIHALCGVQAQDLPAARMSLRPRSNGLTDAGVEAARVGERSFVRTWAMRGTLHLVASDDLFWLRRLLSPGSIRANESRSAQLGLDEKTYRRAMGLIDRALDGGQALGRAALKEALAEGGIDPGGQRMVYLLARATNEGLICEGAFEGRYATYVRVEDWLGKSPPPQGDRAEDLNRLVVRYLDAYGPAAPEDLATWSGLPVSECRTAFRDASLTAVSAGGRAFWITGEPGDNEPPGVRLLPAFDTFLLGYRDRSLHLDPAHVRRVNAGGGIVKPVLMVDGRAAGTWRLVRRPKGAGVSVQPFWKPAKQAETQIEDEVEDLARFLGVPVSLTVEPAQA
jgi:hypothetical protein